MISVIILICALFFKEEKKIELPDLEVKNIRCVGRYIPPRVGDSVSYSFEVVNTGKASADGTFRSAIYYENEFLSQNDYISYHISPGESIGSSGGGGGGGTYTESGENTICVVMDSKNEINESNENNNKKCATVEVFPKKETGLPDLQIKNLRYYKSPNVIYIGDATGYKFDIFNGGDADFSGNVGVGYTYTTKRIEDFKEITGLNIPMGGSESVEIISERTFPETGDTELSVIIDFWNTIRELDETNNREAIILNVLPKKYN